MRAPVFPQKTLLTIAMRGRLEDRPLEAEAIETAVEMYLAADAQVTISQNATTIAQLAHEWAKARRARLTLPVVEWKACEEPEPEDAENPERPCFDSTDPNMTSRQHIGPMCPPCRAQAEYYNAKLTLTRKLSGLSARLERACLGPREKKATS